jgi:hypothetical protein
LLGETKQLRWRVVTVMDKVVLRRKQSVDCSILAKEMALQQLFLSDQGRIWFQLQIMQLCQQRRFITIIMQLGTFLNTITVSHHLSS